jgi:HK97 gp10 family phage protein
MCPPAELGDSVHRRSPVLPKLLVGVVGRAGLEPATVRYYFEPGSLRDSIYQAFSKDNSSEFGGGYRNATFHVAWNHRKVPYGHMVEFGTSRAPAHPFLRPAYDAKVQITLTAARGTFAKRLKAEVPGIS